MYANSRFKLEVDEWGNILRWAEPGDEISQSDLGVDDDEWQAILDAGAVVEEYPEGLDPQVPPVEYYRALANAESTMQSAQAAEVAVEAEVTPVSAPTPPAPATPAPTESSASDDTDK